MNFLPRRLSLLAPLIFSLTSGIATSAQAQQSAESGFILTSIKPLQLIAADITQGVIDVEFLLPAGASPHAYSLRPSEVKKIYSAKSIFWVGPTMETFLQKPFSKYINKSHSFTDLITQDLTTQTSTQEASGVVDGHAQESEAEHQEHQENESAHSEHDQHAHKTKIHQHNYQGNDPHIWLSPKKALLMAAIIRDQVTLLYPHHKQLLMQNYQQFSKQMQTLDLQLRSDFSSLKALGFLVFHDAYSRFIEHYQLNQIAALTINPATRPGAKHLADIRQMIQTTKPICIFSEPQFSGVAIKTVVRGFNIEIGELDPLAIDAKAPQNRYTSFIQNFAQQFVDCLGR